jgi:hypothetical protein
VGFGERYDQVLIAFLDEVGRAEELPEWVFRLWASSNEWNTQELVMARMDAHYAVTADGSAHKASDFSYPSDGAWPLPLDLFRWCGPDTLTKRGSCRRLTLRSRSPCRDSRA